MLYAILGASVLSAVIAGGAAWTARGWKADADAAEVVDAMHRGIQAQADRANAAASTYEGQRAAREVQTRYIDREVIRVVQAPVYAGQCFDADGLQLVAAALAGSAPSPGRAASAVPDPDGAR